MWSVKEGATLSLQGGISPKTGAPSKAAIPIGKLEVIYGRVFDIFFTVLFCFLPILISICFVAGVFRAKMMYEGVVSEKLLEAGVKDCARRYIRERLQEMHVSVRVCVHKLG